MLIKIHKTYRDIIAICDSELIGKIFVSQASDDLGKSSEEGKFQLDVKESFYKGEEISEDKAIEVMKNFSKEDAIFNIVGEKSINCALEAGIISEKGVNKIQGVPFAMVLM